MKEHELPPWLNEEYFKTLLGYKIPKGKLLNYDIAAAVQGGNNYCSRMWRVKLNYKDGGEEVKLTSFMIKAPVPDGVHKDMLDKSKFAETEFRFYNTILPKIYRMTDKVEIFPKNYPSVVPETIALEDLKEQGYRMCDRLKMLDYDHCRAVMKTLAEFHALSVALSKQDPIVLNSIGIEGFYSKSPDVLDLLRQSLKRLSNQIKTWNGFERFEYISESETDKFYDKTAEIFSPSRNLNVLSHGDIWTNNIMFKYNGAGDVVHAKLVDFQLCRKGSPGIDLHFFTWTSIVEDVRDNRLDELYAVYLDTLNSKLEELGCEERLSKEQLEEELSITRFYGFFVLCVMLPIFFADPDKPIDFDKIFDTNTMDEDKPFHCKVFNEVAPKILLQLEDTVFKTFVQTL